MQDSAFLDPFTYDAQAEAGVIFPKEDLSAWKMTLEECIVFISKLVGVLSNKAQLVLSSFYHMLKSPVKLSTWSLFASPELPSTT